MKINDLVASRKIKLKIGIFKRDNLNKFSTSEFTFLTATCRGEVI